MIRFLPLGSVVKAKDRLLMISGYRMEASDKKNYDYACILYPEGLSNDYASYGINENDIEKIEYVGFINADAQVYWAKINNNNKSNKGREN